MALVSASPLSINPLTVPSSRRRPPKPPVSPIVCMASESRGWRAVVSTALTAAVISSSGGAMADLNKFEADVRGEFGIGSAAQFGSADLKKAVHVNENFRYYSPEWLGEDSTRKAPHQDIEVTRERKHCILKYYENADERREVNVEFSNFSMCIDDFCNIDAMHDRFILPPLTWWAVHGASAPRLQALAFKLLGQPSSSSCCERNWSTYKFIHSATRNKITPQRAEDLVYVHTNLRLLSRRSQSYKEGPSQMWDVGGDQFDSLDETNLGRLFEDLSLDEPSLEVDLCGNAQENENDALDI